MTSRETTLARVAARDRTARWKAHVADCPRCARSCRAGGRGAGPCKHGIPLYLASESARRELAESIRLDRLPPPGSVPLF